MDGLGDITPIPAGIILAALQANHDAMLTALGLMATAQHEDEQNWETCIAHAYEIHDVRSVIGPK